MSNDEKANSNFALFLSFACSCAFLLNLGIVSAESTGVNPNATYSATRYLQAGEMTFRLVERRALGKLRLDHVSNDQTCTYIVHFEPKRIFNICGQNLVRGFPPSAYDPRREWFEIVSSALVETVAPDGAEKQKYKATFRLTHGQVGEGYFWVRDGVMVGVKLRYMRADGKEEQLIMKLENVVIEAQDPSYFEVPEGVSDITNNI